MSKLITLCLVVGAATLFACQKNNKTAVPAQVDAPTDVHDPYAEAYDEAEMNDEPSAGAEGTSGEYEATSDPEDDSARDESDDAVPPDDAHDPYVDEEDDAEDPTEKPDYLE